MDNLKDLINYDILAEQILSDLKNTDQKCLKCPSCNNIIENIDMKLKTIKCPHCNITFKNNISAINIKLSDEKLFKLITCMIRDFTLEETMKFIDSNAETIRKNWIKVYNQLNWNKYNINVRNEPITRIYASFEVILN